MTTYKITDTQNPNWHLLRNFISLQEAQDYVMNLGNTYSVSVTDEQLPIITPEQKLNSNIQFGNILINTFLLDNRLTLSDITPLETIQLLTQFEKTERLARLGDIKSVKTLLEEMTTDVRLFTDERKNKYLSMINNHINSLM